MWKNRRGMKVDIRSWNDEARDRQETAEIAVVRRTASENCRCTTNGSGRSRQSAYAKPAEADKASADKARDDRRGTTAQMTSAVTDRRYRRTVQSGRWAARKVVATWARRGRVSSDSVSAKRSQFERMR